MRRGTHPERPFVLLAQASLFDATRAPTGKHTAWAYATYRTGPGFDMLGRLEAQIERFAPGFRECFWPDAFLAPPQSKRWMQIWSEATSAAGP